jgi:hypothetical protein
MMSSGQKVYTVMIQGWGDDEDEFYSFGVYSTEDKAQARVEELLKGWEEDGFDRNDVVWEIEESVLDAD